MGGSFSVCLIKGLTHLVKAITTDFCAEMNERSWSTITEEIAALNQPHRDLGNWDLSASGIELF